jgi:TatD DNase family protein
MRQLEKAYPFSISVMAGLHPTHVGPGFEQELTYVHHQLSTEKCIAVGEIGIDLYWDKTYLEEQQAAFARQIQWARDFNLPFAIHCRQAFDEVFDVLTSFDGLHRGVFHCFSGDFSQAQRAISLGLHLGIGGVVTFKNGQIDQWINQIPLEHLVLETDAPYLAPAPHRGKRNEPEFLTLVVTKLAALYGVSEQEIGQVTTANAKNLFNWSDETL